MNTFIFFIEIIIVYGSLVLVDKFIGKPGVFAWIAFASVLANIITSGQVTTLGLDVAMGTVLFSSVYLATDILTEKYGFEESKKGVYIGLIFVVLFMLLSQIWIRYCPSEFDYIIPSLRQIFTLSLRVSISSVVMFFLSNLCDVYIFNTFRKRHGDKKLWLRNNVSTILCNCLENFFFIMGAFLGVYTFKDCLSIALGTSLIEIVAGLCDTPFLYWSKHNKIKGED